MRARHVSSESWYVSVCVSCVSVCVHILMPALFSLGTKNVFYILVRLQFATLCVSTNRSMHVCSTVCMHVPFMCPSFGREMPSLFFQPKAISAIIFSAKERRKQRTGIQEAGMSYTYIRSHIACLMQIHAIMNQIFPFFSCGFTGNFNCVHFWYMAHFLVWCEIIVRKHCFQTHHACK